MTYPTPRYLVVDAPDVAETRETLAVVPGAPRTSLDGSQAILRVEADADGLFPEGALTLAEIKTLTAGPAWSAPDEEFTDEGLQ